MKEEVRAHVVPSRNAPDENGEETGAPTARGSKRRGRRRHPAQGASTNATKAQRDEQEGSEQAHAEARERRGAQREAQTGKERAKATERAGRGQATPETPAPPGRHGTLSPYPYAVEVQTGVSIMAGIDDFRARQYETVVLIRHLLAEGEEVIDAGIAQSVEVAEMAGRGGGEGILYLTDSRLIFRLDSGGGCAEVRLANLSALTVKWIIARKMSRLVVAYKEDAMPYTANYYLGTKFGKQLEQAVRRL